MSYKPDHMPNFNVYLTVRNPQKTIEFYQSAFGFELTVEVMRDDSGNITHVAMRYKDSIIMFGPEGGEGVTQLAPSTTKVSCPVSFYLYNESCEAFHTKAVAAGAKSLLPPEDMFWGDKMCQLEDPDGYQWSFATFNE